MYYWLKSLSGNLIDEKSFRDAIYSLASYHYPLLTGYITVLVVNYGISNIVVVKIP